MVEVYAKYIAKCAPSRLYSSFVDLTVAIGAEHHSDVNVHFEFYDVGELIKVQ